ncbi:MAG TPA: hypothetical protein VJB15_09455, partial [Rhodothermia bacterium]|nr:hypothetical protein [Rhodothermia bacterium]
MSLLIFGALQMSCSTSQEWPDAPSNLTASSSDEVEPAFSPDGSQIAYKSDLVDGLAAIFVMPAGGGEGKRVTDTQNWLGHFDWSPDGNRIAYSSDLEAPPDIWVVSSDGSNRKRLTSGRGLEFIPRWSPDGTVIAYSSNEGGFHNLYVVPAEGGEIRAITTGAANRFDQR